MEMKRVIALIGLVLALSAGVNAQQKTSPPTSSTSTVIAIPAARASVLKQIQERQQQLAALQQQLAAEIEKVEAQKTSVILRIALELKMSAEQLDQMEIVSTGDGGFMFRVREKPEPKKEPSSAK